MSHITRLVFICSIVLMLSAPSLNHAEKLYAVESPPAPFESDARGEVPTDSPMIKPWRTITIDGEYGGQWVVVGDVDGDGVVEIVAAKNHNQGDVHYTSSIVAQRLDGSVLWRWGDPKLGRHALHHDVACQIHDLDGDGINEVIAAADRELVVLDGPTGKPKHSFPIEKDASDCVLFADLSGKGRAGEIIVKTRYEQIWAYDSAGKLLWSVRQPGGYPTAHQPLPVDLDGDGREEILAGYAALNPDGSIRWVFEAEEGKRNGGHADCWRVVHVAQNPQDTRLVLTMCGGDTLVMTDGNGRLIWKKTGCHYESVDVGDIRPDIPGLELAVDVDHLATRKRPLSIFDQKGSLLGNIITDGTRFHILADWNSDGVSEIGSALPRGLFDGRGRRLLTFDIGPGEKPVLIASGEMSGDGGEDVLLTTTSHGVYKAYIYKNLGGKSGKMRPLGGTGPNFTLY